MFFELPWVNDLCTMLLSCTVPDQVYVIYINNITILILLLLLYHYVPLNISEMFGNQQMESIKRCPVDTCFSFFVAS